MLFQNSIHWSIILSVLFGVWKQSVVNYSGSIITPLFSGWWILFSDSSWSCSSSSKEIHKISLHFFLSCNWEKTIEFEKKKRKKEKKRKKTETETEVVIENLKICFAVQIFFFSSFLLSNKKKRWHKKEKKREKRKEKRIPSSFFEKLIFMKSSTFI